MTANAPAPAAPSNWNAPNVITGARILATPFFLWMLLADGGTDGPWRWAAAVFFVLAIATDAWDGHIARSRGLITDLGKLLDPIADKFLTGAALVGLSILAELPWWVTVLILVREVGITVHRLLVAHDVVLAAAWAGKVKTVAQSVAITLALLPLAGVVGSAAPLVEWVNIITMTIAFILTITSGLDYIVGYARARRAAR
ncbi:CDP-diacylglycerol--glycerol-3-phosphate 3-phosphatidyltransferase [Leucobacter chromiiresistens]|uniref:CDP-diacylglycerol--glycerol-3-phosphate 3-phosphatidyltransferase n=1 Tax=Leucobacter chromiiresistens TaxID=1079994 RepID=A0A1H1AHZ9_9MICO|nr:CDP-diacylglycerol--glycerol-3-phosphate 3-phosphatidyltransferase [Leucobacter chromiiresistens]SDQ39292.1 CDP-diacylglycerol--glycerol-3-phosphate 3-phosphatidyltransferase [Leucobacter chromiiresistens]SDQ54868.1 CDP-diacylglycerol--glycerol-3-phosphate 3-phosphatidyltransferase [Leucobacter chromiiresistens]